MSRETKEQKIAVLKATLGELLDIVDVEDLADQMVQIMEEIDHKNAKQ